MQKHLIFRAFINNCRHLSVDMIRIYFIMLYMCVLLICLVAQFSTHYKQFVESPQSDTIFVRLIRGTYRISDFADNPAALWFYRSHVDDPEADSLLRKTSMRPNFHLGAVLRWEAQEAADHKAAAEKLHLAAHFDSSAIENFLSFLTLGFTNQDINHFKTALSLPVFSNLRTQLYLGTNIGILLLAAVFMSSLIYALVKMVFYLPVLSHQIPPRVHVRTIDIAKALILLAPVLVLRNLYLAFIIYSFLLILALNKREMGWLRFNLIMLMLMFLLSLPLNSFIVFLEEHNNTYQLYEIVHYDSSPQVEANTKQEKALLAYGQKQQDKLEEALALYEELYYDNYRTAAVTNNLANVYFAYDETAKAESLYIESLLLKDRGEPYFNMGLIKLKNIEYTESERYMAEARRRGFSSVHKEPVDIKPTNREFFNIMFAEPFSFNGLVKHIYVLPLLALFVLSFFRMRLSSPFFCNSCDRPLCKTCIKDVEGETLCTNCFEKFKSTKQAETEADLRRLAGKTKARTKQIILYAINIIVPGAGLIYIGKHFAGLVLVGIVMVGYIPVFFPGIFVQPAGWIALPSDILLRFIAIIIAIIAYIVSFTAIKEYHAH